MKLSIDEKTLLYTVRTQEQSWSQADSYAPHLLLDGTPLYFNQAGQIFHRDYTSGLGCGIRTIYDDFPDYPGLRFETIVWVEDATQDVIFQWIPLKEDSISIEEVVWPGPFAFDQRKDSWYTLLNYEQGLLIPNTWSVPLGALMFDGQMCTAASYMPWFGQVRDHSGYIAICEQPWDAKYAAVHPENGPFTHVWMRLLPSLGRMSYSRSIRYTFLDHCDYNTLCKRYRSYVKETGLFTSLAEKAARVPSVDQLIGSSFIHQGIKTQVQPDSRFFDPDAPDKNNRLIPFSYRTQQLKHFQEAGYQKLYLHLDGWGDPGYDNMHPDYSPACKDAGGWSGMKELADTAQNAGYLFGIHDQYRDYYYAAPSFDEAFACHNPDGSVPQHANWAGGHQAYLCTTQAPGYVKRNFAQLFASGIHPDCAYLDVFTCNEPDECSQSEHRMTRKDSLDFRSQCFSYLLSQGILTSSEEVTDWSIPSLVFCHYAPYSFMMHKPGTPQKGIGVPLFNLVYHDCMIIPWMMDKVSETEDYMLYALLNGGAPYFIRDGAYPNTDGSFETEFEFSEEERYARCQIVAKLHEKIAKCEMVRHEFVDGDYMVQRTVFGDGTEVLVDLRKQKFEIR